MPPEAPTNDQPWSADPAGSSAKRPANHSLLGPLDFHDINRLKRMFWTTIDGSYIFAPPVTHETPYENGTFFHFEGAGIFPSTVSTVWPEVLFETKLSRVLTKNLGQNCNQFGIGTYFRVTVFWRDANHFLGIIVLNNRCKDFKKKQCVCLSAQNMSRTRYFRSKWDPFWGGFKLDAKFIAILRGVLL